MFYKNKYRIIELEAEIKDIKAKLKDFTRSDERLKRLCEDYRQASSAEHRRSLDLESIVAEYLTLIDAPQPVVAVRSNLKNLISLEKEKAKAAKEEALAEKITNRVFEKWGERTRTCTVSATRHSRVFEAPVETRNYSPGPKDPNAANTL